MDRKNLKLFCAAAAAVSACLLFSADFPGWTPEGAKASLSDASRVPGEKSLRIEQYDDSEQNSAWLGPVMKNEGKPVLISFWGADNYLKQTDGSYAGTVDVIEYGKDGKEKSRTMEFQRIAWDDAEKYALWGLAFPETIQWKYYETVYQPSADTFRLLFHWPKPIVRGECYITEVKVTDASPEDTARLLHRETAESHSETPFRLELSSAAQGNIFYTDDPLRFEALLFRPDKQDIALKDPVIRWDITDFENHFIAKGEQSFAAAVPVADPAFYKSRAGQPRAKNLRLTVPVNGENVKDPGRLFFLHAVLMDDGKAIAEDTVPYAAFLPPSESDRGRTMDSRFTGTFFHTAFRDTLSPHRDGGVSAKTGLVMTHCLDYNWKNCQPKYPGPITFKSKLPPYPKMIFCPNIEQERQQDAWLKRMVPPECLIPDPGRKDHLTFQIEPYVEYMLAYIRHNRDAVVAVIPSGLERHIDARTIELHKKAYAAIKKEFPDMPVGFMLYGLPTFPSTDIDLFVKEELFPYADFISTQVPSRGRDSPALWAAGRMWRG